MIHPDTHHSILRRVVAILGLGYPNHFGRHADKHQKFLEELYAEYRSKYSQDELIRKKLMIKICNSAIYGSGVCSEIAALSLYFFCCCWLKNKSVIKKLNICLINEFDHVFLKIIYEDNTIQIFDPWCNFISVANIDVMQIQYIHLQKLKLINSGWNKHQNYTSISKFEIATVKNANSFVGDTKQLLSSRAVDYPRIYLILNFELT